MSHVLVIDCPRCGAAGEFDPAARSQTDHTTTICVSCYLEEAMENFFAGEVSAQSAWPVPDNLDNARRMKTVINGLGHAIGLDHDVVR